MVLIDLSMDQLAALMSLCEFQIRECARLIEESPANFPLIIAEIGYKDILESLKEASKYEPKGPFPHTIKALGDMSTAPVFKEFLYALENNEDCSKSFEAINNQLNWLKDRLLP